MKLFDPDLDFLGSKPLSPTFIHSKKSLLVVGADTGNILLDPGTFSRGFELDNELDNNLPCVDMLTFRGLSRAQLFVVMP